jgi:transcriptional regulator
MERNSFATLVTKHTDGRLVASHIPLLLVRDGSENGYLLGHVARGNDQWRDVTGETLAIFRGPHAYISPRWYEANEVVPTWNYVAVHAYGPLEIISDREEFRELLRKLIDTFETGVDNPWTLERSGEAVDRLLVGIVGFRIPIARIEGKWKLSQNHPAERQAKVIAALERQGGEDAKEIAALMRKNLKVSSS